MYVAFYDDTVVMNDGGSVIRDSVEEVWREIRARFPDTEWELLTIYELSKPIYSDGVRVEQGGPG